MEYPIPRHKLIKARKSRRLSQEAVAEGAKMSRKALYACEQGLSNPRDDTIKLLCAYFQMSKEELDLDIVVAGKVAEETPNEQLPAQLGDPENACTLLRQTLDMIIQTRSAVGLQHVYKARAELKPWKNSAEVKGLDYRLDLTVKALKQRTEDS